MACDSTGKPPVQKVTPIGSVHADEKKPLSITAVIERGFGVDWLENLEKAGDGQRSRFCVGPTGTFVKKVWFPSG